MRLFELRSGQESVAAGGVHQLNAEARWILEGDAGTVAEVVARLGRVATRLTGTSAELSFGNAVGWYDAGALGHLDVSSGKWGDGAYDLMLRDLTERAAALPYSVDTPSSLPYERTELDSEAVLYHAFAYLRQLLGTPRRPGLELLGPLRSVLARPHRKTARHGRVVPAGLARRVDPGALVGIAAGRWPLRRTAAGGVARRLRGLAPEEVEESVLAHELDTPENRFVRALLDLCAGVVHRVRTLVPGERRLGPRTLAFCEWIEACLRSVRAHPMWGEVGRLVHFPSASTVLQRRHDYRALFGIYNRLRLGSRLPLEPRDASQWLEVKDIANLYETWTCFATITALEPILGRPAAVRRPRHSSLEATVDWDLQASWDDGTQLHYNPTFSRSGATPRSYSERLRPDLVLTIPSGPSAGRHVFDAKFKLRSFPVTDGEPSRAGMKREDLHTMHAYRDALEGVQSAWVLYPGTELGFYPRVGAVARDLSGLPDAFDGVGGIPLSPLGDANLFGGVLRRLCGKEPTP